MPPTVHPPSRHSFGDVYVTPLHDEVAHCVVLLTVWHTDERQVFVVHALLSSQCALEPPQHLGEPPPLSQH